MFHLAKYDELLTHELFLLLTHSPTSGGVVTLKTGRQEVPGSNPGRACRPSRSEFPMVFSETLVNTGQDLLERYRRRASRPQAKVHFETIGLNLTSNQLTLVSHHFYCQFTRITENIHYIYIYILKKCTAQISLHFKICFFIITFSSNKIKI